MAANARRRLGIDRWGPRRLALYGLALLGLAALASAVAHVPAVFYASYTLFRLSTGLGGTLAVMAMLNNWFRRRRAMAMALVLILPGLVVVLSTPLPSPWACCRRCMARSHR